MFLYIVVNLGSQYMYLDHIRCQIIHATRIFTLVEHASRNIIIYAFDSHIVERGHENPGSS